MRILHVVNTYLPVRNGVTVSVSGWVDALRRKGHEVGVWTVSADGCVAEGVSAVRGAFAVAHGFPLPLSLRPPREVVASPWDVVHAHHPVLLGPAAVAMGRRTGATVAATAHSDYAGYADSYAPPISGMVKPLVRGRMRRFFDSADVVFAPSAGIERAMHSWRVGTRIERCTYPIDLSKLRPVGREDARRLLGLAEDVPLAVYVGRMASDKRVERLLAEFGRTLAAVPNALLVLVGDGPLLERVRQAARPLGDRVVLTGRLPVEEVGMWYSAADIFTSASGNEVGPMSTIEAGLCGTPTVAMRVPGFVDRIDDGATGLLAATAPGALAGVMIRALSDREASHRMGRRAAEVFARHEPLSSAEGLLAAYERAFEAVVPARRHVRRPQLKADAE